MKVLMLQIWLDLPFSLELLITNIMSLKKMAAFMPLEDTAKSFDLYEAVKKIH